MKTEGHQSDRMSISPCDAVPILKRTGKFQPGPEIFNKCNSSGQYWSQHTLTFNYYQN